mmetsp:Transcript_22180/g.43131  ORF Transcript_22180/g.43131 Transcript_22180/m.43131 type:complete len:195 (-) Transcript_22180:298-882(-)
MVKKIFVSDYDCPGGRCPEAPHATVHKEQDEWKLKIAQILVAKEQLKKKAAVEALSKLTIPDLCDRCPPAFEPDPFDSNMPVASPTKSSACPEGLRKSRRTKSLWKRFKKSKQSSSRWTLYTILETTPEESSSSSSESAAATISEKETFGHSGRENRITEDDVHDASEPITLPVLLKPRKEACMLPVKNAQQRR